MIYSPEDRDPLNSLGELSVGLSIKSLDDKQGSGKETQEKRTFLLVL